MQGQELQEEGRNDISLLDMMNCLKRGWSLILAVGLFGLISALVYTYVAPKYYEATWQVRMAQFANANSEESALLLYRLRMPTTYPDAVLQRCGFAENGRVGGDMVGALKAQEIRNVPSAVELKLRAASQAQAQECAEAIVEMIVQQQQGLIEERLAGRAEQLAQYQEALKKEQQDLERLKKADIGNFGYLAKLDRLSWLRTRIDALQEESMLSQKHPARLIAPINVSSKPVSPRMALMSLAGALLGLMLGAVFVLGREVWRKAQPSMSGL